MDVIGQIAADLKAADCGSGFNRRNLFYMRRFAQLWADFQFVQPVAAQIGWTHHQVLMDNFADDKETYLWYANKCAKEGWSKRFLQAQIALKLHKRQGKSINNFSNALEASEAEQTNELIKDSYVFDFLNLDNKVKEHDLEQALLTNIRKFLIELSTGFALYGQQMALKVGNQEFYPDLVFYHHVMRRFVVIELKMGTFTPEAAGKMNFYLTAVDNNICIDGDKESIGIILCADYDNNVGATSIERIISPIAISSWSQPGNTKDTMSQQEIKDMQQVEEQLIEKVQQSLPQENDKSILEGI